MKITSLEFSREVINDIFTLKVNFIGDQHNVFDNCQLERIRSLYQLGFECGMDLRSKLCSTHYDPQIRIDERLYSNLKVEKVIFNDPATIVFWNDGSKTVVKCGEGETFDEEKGFAIACTKKMFGNNHIYYGKMQKAIEKAVRKETDNDNSKK